MTGIPLPAGTDIGEMILGKLFGRSQIYDAAGTEIGGAILARMVSLLSSVDGIETLIAATNTALGGTLTVGLPTGAASAAKQDAIKASVDALAPMLDGVEGLLNAIGAAITGATYYPATQAISAAAMPLPPGAATDAKVEAVRALLAGTIAISAAALPLPAGAATDAKVEAVRALLAGTIAVSAAALPLPSGAATEAKVEAVRALLAGTIAISAASLPLPTGAATAAKQDAQKSSIDLTTPATDGFAISPGPAALATVPKALWVVSGGTLSLGGPSNTPLNFGTVVTGQVIPFGPKYVYSAGTSATVLGLI